MSTSHETFQVSACIEISDEVTGTDEENAGDGANHNTGDGNGGSG